MQLAHAGRFSSHLILRCLRARYVSAARVHRIVCTWYGIKIAATYLQLLHPVLTLGLLVRARFGLCSASPPPRALSGIGGIACIMDAMALEHSASASQRRSGMRWW